MPPTPQRVRLTLRALPDRVPAHHRLKRLLKSLLRAYRFRCERLEVVRDEAKAAG